MSDFTLYDYQENILNWMNNKKSKYKNNNTGILFVKMGLGKTFTTLEYLKRKKSQSLIICSKTLLNEWDKQINKFYKNNEFNYLIFHNDYCKINDVTISDLSEKDLIITTYQTIVNANKELNFDKNYFNTNDKGIFTEIKDKNNIISNKKTNGKSILYNIVWDTVICDEIQYITNYKTKAYKSVYSLPYRNFFGLSGTPIKNNRLELISLVKLMVNGLNKIRRWKQEPFTFFDLFYNLDYSGTNIKLPEKNIKNIYIEMTESQREMYKYLLMNKDYECFLDYLTSLRLVQTDLSIYYNTYKIKHDLDNKERYQINFNEFKNTITTNKLYEIYKILEEIKNRKEKVIIFCSYTIFLDVLTQDFENNNINSTIILSNDSINKRKDKIEEWQKSSDLNILLMNYKIGSEGLNLVEANNIILIDSWWNQNAEDQAIARAWRIGQVKPVNIYKLIAKNTIEEILIKKSKLKSEIYEKVKNQEDIKCFVASDTKLDLLFREVKKINDIPEDDEYITMSVGKGKSSKKNHNIVIKKKKTKREKEKEKKTLREKRVLFFEKKMGL
jgi:SNF2 family DNA or RNA helicase